MQSERVTFLTSPEGKASIAARAAANGVSIGEYIRRKVEDNDDLTSAQEEELQILIDQINLAVPRIRKSLESATSILRDLRKENDEFFSSRGIA